MSHTHRHLIMLLCPLILMVVLTSCHTHKTISATHSTLESAELLRELSSHSTIEIVDTILFTPTICPDDAPTQPAANAAVPLPFSIRRHALLTCQSSVRDTAYHQAGITQMDSTARLNNLDPFHSYGFDSVNMNFFSVIAIIVVTILIAGFFITRIRRRPL